MCPLIWTHVSQKKKIRSPQERVRSSCCYININIRYYLKGAQNKPETQKAVLMMKTVLVLARPLKAREPRAEAQLKRMIRLSLTLKWWRRGVTTRLPRLLQRVESVL